MIEHCPIATYEAVFGIAVNVPLVVLHREADVKDLTVVVHVPIVSVCLTLTAKTVIIWRGQEVLSTRRKTIQSFLWVIIVWDMTRPASRKLRSKALFLY